MLTKNVIEKSIFEIVFKYQVAGWFKKLFIGYLCLILYKDDQSHELY